MSDDSSAPAAPRTVMVASIQMASVFADPAANESRARVLIREAAATGAKIAVLPETAIQGYLSQDIKTVWHAPGRPLSEHTYAHGVDPADFAETVDGPMMQRFAALASELDMYITVPYLEKLTRPLEYVDEDAEEEEDEPAEGALERAETVYFNSVALVGPENATKALGNYRKMSPWPTPESSWACKGTEPVFVDTRYGRVGLAICFDIHSCLAKYARHRLWALLYPIAWVGEPMEWYRQQLPSLLRQCECPHYVIGCNWSTDAPQKWPGQGFSTHYGPRGEVLASTADQHGSTVMYSTIFTADALEAQRVAADKPRLSLKLDKYSEWTNTIGGQSNEWRSKWC